MITTTIYKTAILSGLLILLNVMLPSSAIVSSGLPLDLIPQSLETLANAISYVLVPFSMIWYPPWMDSLFTLFMLLATFSFNFSLFYKIAFILR